MRDFNVQSAAKELVCNYTCVYHSAMLDRGKVSCELADAAVARPKGGTCPNHSLKGYTGGMKKISNAMAYADAYAKKQAEEMKAKLPKEK